jgi:hypothetical protein
MSLRLFFAQFYLPMKVRRKKLCELFNVTASAFGVFELTCKKTGSFNDLLEDYAKFTKNAAEKSLHDKTSSALVEKKLFEGALFVGEQLRRELKMKNFRDFCRALRLIYKSLKIDCACNKNREVVVRKCFFSNFYSAAVCALIASLDAGLVAGLSGGRKLTFYERITENKPCCRGRISP